MKLAEARAVIAEFDPYAGKPYDPHAVRTAPVRNQYGKSLPPGFPQKLVYQGRPYHWTGKVGTDVRTGEPSAEYQRDVDKEALLVWRSASGKISESLIEADTLMRSRERVAMATGDSADAAAARRSLNRVGRAPAGEVFYSEIAKRAVQALNLAAGALAKAAEDADFRFNRDPNGRGGFDVIARTCRAMVSAARSAAVRISRARFPMVSTYTPSPVRMVAAGDDYAGQLRVASDYVEAAASLLRQIAFNIESPNGMNNDALGQQVFLAVRWLSFFGDAISATRDRYAGYYFNEKWKEPIYGLKF
jgi:hypothetical protein